MKRNTIILVTALMLGCKNNLSTAGFSLNKSVFEVNEQVVPVNLSTDTKTYKWYFGDGSESSEHSPVHRYQIPGRYRIRLLADHSSEMSKEITVVAASAVNVYVR